MFHLSVRSAASSQPCKTPATAATYCVEGEELRAWWCIHVAGHAYLLYVGVVSSALHMRYTTRESVVGAKVHTQPDLPQM